MERAIARAARIALPEGISFLLKAGVFLIICGLTLFFSLASSYPAVHDTLHQARHALAVVPCH